MSNAPHEGASDPPSLTPSWGAFDTLWLAIGGYFSDGSSASAPPTNYISLLTSGDLASAQRNLHAVSENPGVFTDAGSYGIASLAQTIAIKGVSAVLGFNMPMLGM